MLIRQDGAETDRAVAAAIATAGQGQWGADIREQRTKAGGGGAHGRRMCGGQRYTVVRTGLTMCYTVGQEGVHRSRLGAHPGMREGGRHDSPLLLPRETHDRRQLQNVSGRGGARAEARRFLCMAGTAWDGGQDEQPAHTQGTRGRDGVPTRQPPT